MSSAASAAASAAPSSPPINSTKRSMPGDRAKATQSSNQAKLARLIPRCFSLRQAEIPAIAICRPVRRRSASACRSSSVITAAPTVPRPAMPMRRGGGMDATPAKPEGGRRQRAAAEGLFARFSRGDQGRAGPREGDRVKRAAKLNLAKSSDSNRGGFCWKRVAELGANAEPIAGRQKSCGCRRSIDQTEGFRRRPDCCSMRPENAARMVQTRVWINGHRILATLIAGCGASRTSDLVLRPRREAHFPERPLS